MEHVKITFNIASDAESEMLIAMLAEVGYDGFEETPTELLAYIESHKFQEDELKAIAEASGIKYRTETIPAQNWNALWESNFEPVVVEGFCTIRAHFHDVNTDTPYNITITPKMSFGTGHHATTQQMIILMKDIAFSGCSVLDFGTGTGVLAILAEMLGAKNILAIDNDEWSVENTKENIERNNCRNILVEQASLEDIPVVKNDMILANINRNILLQYMEQLFDRLNNEGHILMSGLLVEDRDMIVEAAHREGFRLIRSTEQSNWIALLLKK